MYFDNMVRHIYPAEIQLNRANTTDTEFSFLDLHLSISNDIFLPKFMISVTILILKLSIPFFDGDVPRSTSYGVYISQLIRFATTFSHVADFNICNKLLTQKLLNEGYRYHTFLKTFFLNFTANTMI